MTSKSYEEDLINSLSKHLGRMKVMNRNEKKAKKDYISKYLDTNNTRLKDEEVEFLCDFIDEYDDKYKGETHTKENSYTGWSSDGKYTRTEENTYTFSDDIGIHEEYKYYDDDGQTGESSGHIKDARGILNWFKKQK